MRTLPNGTLGKASVLALLASVGMVVHMSAAEGPPSQFTQARRVWPPYSAGSFWNQEIPANIAIRADSAALLQRITLQGGGVMTSDVTQNSYPIYYVDKLTPRAAVVVENYFSYFENFGLNKDGVRRGAGFNPTILNVPIPTGATSGDGDDSQILFWNPTTGEEWSFWQFYDDAGTLRATNGYLYNTLLGTGRMLGSGRGAGVSKLGGLVSAHEVEVEGLVNHAVAFGFDAPSPQWVYPATKSDGDGVVITDMPEGARLQLDPTLTNTDFIALGLSPQARVIARALQRFGLIVIDNSGRPKAFLESDATGAWANPAAMEFCLRPLTRNAQGQPDWSRFRVIDWDVWTGRETGLQGP